MPASLKLELKKVSSSRLRPASSPSPFRFYRLERQNNGCLNSSLLLLGTVGQILVFLVKRVEFIKNNFQVQIRSKFKPSTSP